MRAELHMLIPGLAHRTSTDALLSFIFFPTEGMVATKTTLETKVEAERLPGDPNMHSALLHEKLRFYCI